MWQEREQMKHIFSFFSVLMKCFTFYHLSLLCFKITKGVNNCFPSFFPNAVNVSKFIITLSKYLVQVNLKLNDLLSLSNRLVIIWGFISLTVGNGVTFLWCFSFSKEIPNLNVVNYFERRLVVLDLPISMTLVIPRFFKT